MFDVVSELTKISENEYAAFTAKLNPNINSKTILGVRVPKLRALAKEFGKTNEWLDFLHTLPHTYYEENMLHAILLSNKIKDYNECIQLLDAFLPYVDNWSVCDTLRPAIFKKSQYASLLLKEAARWASSSKEFTCRFGVEVLEAYFLDDSFDKSILEIPSTIISDKYYVKMMVAWFYATALAKQWNDTIPYIENKKLPVWTHNKAIQKARESYRITSNQKEYLNTLKIK